MLRLDAILSAELLAQPESGMGCQIVETTASNGKLQHGVAYNAVQLKC